MTPKIQDIIDCIEHEAPASLQESYDNAGLIVGNAGTEVTGILLTLDCTEAIVDEAIALGANLIVAHHPIIFAGIKKLNGKNYVEKTVMKAIKHDIAIYAAHTNLDNVHTGVNRKLAEKLGLKNLKIAAPKDHVLEKLTVFVPQTHTEQVLKAMADGGAGNIGEYNACSFRVAGKGRFTPGAEADPHIGTPGKPEEVTEDRIEAVVPFHTVEHVLREVRKVHPYEEIAYYRSRLENKNQETGSGMVGEFETGISEPEFLNLVKKVLKVPVVKHTRFTGALVKKVALCGGAGSFLLRTAIGHGAQVYLSGDFKYHEFFDAEDKLMIVDPGHYETEQYTPEIFFEMLSKKFGNIALFFSKVLTNPVNYY